MINNSVVQGHGPIDLSYWEKIKSKNLPVGELKKLICQKDFFRAPKDTPQIEKKHAILIDAILGFSITRSEEQLQAKAKSLWPDSHSTPGHFTMGPLIHQGVQTWVGLDPQTLNSPYSVILKILTTLELKKGDRIIDLGAAHGRMGVVLSCFKEDVFYLGVEYASERVELAQSIYHRLYLKNCQMICADITKMDFEVEEYDIYFIYDFGKLADIYHILHKLNQLRMKRSLKVVARGAQTLDMIKSKFNWEEKKKNKELDFKIFSLTPDH